MRFPFHGEAVALARWDDLNQRRDRGLVFLVEFHYDGITHGRGPFCSESNDFSVISDAVLLFAVSRTDARIHVEHEASWRTPCMNPVNPLS